MQTFAIRVLMLSVFLSVSLGLVACNRSEPEAPVSTAPAESAPLASSEASAENPALWRLHAKGNFSQILAGIKNALQVAQFQLTGEENLAKGLEKNKHLFANEEWNTIGFDNVTALHFCSVVFNQEVFNIDMDWSVLCPFKVVAYTMKSAPDQVTIVMFKPTYLMAKDSNKKAKDVAKRIEDRITSAIKEGLS